MPQTYLPQLISEEFNISRSEARRALVLGEISINGETIYGFDIDSETLETSNLERTNA